MRADWRVYDSQRRQCSPVKAYDMNGVTARQIFLPKNMSENPPKDTLDFVEFCLYRWHKTTYMEGMKETYSCLQGHFMIMGTWGSNKPFQPATYRLSVTNMTVHWHAHWITSHSSTLIDNIGYKINVTDAESSVKWVTLGEHLKKKKKKDKINTAGFMCKQR